jgi:hypothetical protein
MKRRHGSEVARLESKLRDGTSASSYIYYSYYYFDSSHGATLGILLRGRTAWPGSWVELQEDDVGLFCGARVPRTLNRRPGAV